MLALQTFARLCWLFRAAQCVPYLLPRISSRLPAIKDEEWEMALSGGSQDDQPVWVAQRPVTEEPDFKTLYGWANKGFNWVRKQEGALTQNGNLLVAALYLPSTQRIYASTIPRGRYREQMPRHNYAPIWNKQRKVMEEETGGYKRLDAEDAVYYFSENVVEESGAGTGFGRYEGGKIAVWAVLRTTGNKISRENGFPYSPCPECEEMAMALGVSIDPPRWDDPL